MNQMVEQVFVKLMDKDRRDLLDAGVTAREVVEDSSSNLRVLHWQIVFWEELNLINEE